MAAEFILDPVSGNHYLRLTENTNIVTFNSSFESAKEYRLFFQMGDVPVHSITKSGSSPNFTITGTNSNITLPSGKLRLNSNINITNTISSNFLYLDDGGGGDADLDDLIIGGIYTSGTNNANASNSAIFYFFGSYLDSKNYIFKLSSIDTNGSIINPPPSPSLQNYSFTVSKEANHRNVIFFTAYVPGVGTHEFYIDSNEIPNQNANTSLTKSVYSNVEYNLRYESLFNIEALGKFIGQSEEEYTSTQTTGNLLILGGSQIGNLYAYPGQQYEPVITRQGVTGNTGRGIKTKNNNIWKTPLKEYVKHNSQWKEVQASWVKQNNEWKKVFPVGNNWINMLEPIAEQHDYLDFAIQVVAIN